MSVAGIDGKYLDHPEQYLLEHQSEGDKDQHQNTEVVENPSIGGKSLFQEMLNFSSLKKTTKTNDREILQGKGKGKEKGEKKGFKPPSIQQLVLLRNRLKKISKKNER